MQALFFGVNYMKKTLIFIAGLTLPGIIAFLYIHHVAGEWADFPAIENSFYTHVLPRMLVGFYLLALVAAVVIYGLVWAVKWVVFALGGLRNGNRNKAAPLSYKTPE
jgi:uncharacterized sodium:solute symporter family permease YidK